ncbi:MAG TPA: NAD-dependent epimerase/dehydratase family protein [bacterium]|jgi:nucleoside-diphosphate-sugar epimerase
MTRRVLITGGTGFLGSHTVEKYLAAGWTVRALVRNPAKLGWLEKLPIEVAYGTLTDPASLAEAVKDCDVVVHCAGLTKAVQASEYFRINADATRQLTQLAAKSGVRRLVLCSSQAAAGPSSPGKPAREDDVPAPISDYGRSKLAGERAVIDAAGGMEWIVIRPPSIIGPRDEQFVPLFRGVVRYGIYPRFGTARRRYSFAGVHDVARALRVAGEAEQGANTIYFVAHDEALDWGEAAAIIAGFAHRKVRPLLLPECVVRIVGSLADRYASLSGKPQLLSGDKFREILAPEWRCSVEKIRSAWGFTCTWSREQTLRETYESYRNSGLL